MLRFTFQAPETFGAFATNMTKNKKSKADQFNSFYFFYFFLLPCFSSDSFLYIHVCSYMIICSHLGILYVIFILGIFEVKNISFVHSFNCKLKCLFLSLPLPPTFCPSPQYGPKTSTVPDSPAPSLSLSLNGTLFIYYK